MSTYKKLYGTHSSYNMLAIRLCVKKSKKAYLQNALYIYSMMTITTYLTPATAK